MTSTYFRCKHCQEIFSCEVGYRAVAKRLDQEEAVAVVLAERIGYLYSSCWDCLHDPVAGYLRRLETETSRA